jgi:protein-S-isoprenylcysteine O-methyltransferase
VLSLLVNAVMIAWPASEIALVVLRRARGEGACRRDRGSALVLWSAIGVGVAGAVACRLIGLGPLPLSPRATAVAALALLLSGSALRWWSILTLGRFFTVDVAVHEGHRLVQSGPYRVLRHPSYTGLLVSFAGLGLGLGTWAGLLALLVPVGLGLARRIAVEERVLAAELGEEHARWSERTWRLVPFAW